MDISILPWKKVHPIGPLDTLIAAHAVSLDMVLVRTMHVNSHAYRGYVWKTGLKINTCHFDGTHLG